jgi:hypothetical protein
MRGTNQINGFISHRCSEYHKEYVKTVFESYLCKKRINPIYGCSLEPDIKGIISSNIEKAMQKSHVFFAFITPSWGDQHKPTWPKKEWDIWRKIKKDTFSYDCCIGFSLNYSVTHRSRSTLFLPSYISELISYSVSFDKDDHYNSILHRFGHYELFINARDKKQMLALLGKYMVYFHGIRK